MWSLPVWADRRTARAAFVSPLLRSPSSLTSHPSCREQQHRLCYLADHGPSTLLSPSPSTIATPLVPISGRCTALLLCAPPSEASQPLHRCGTGTMSAEELSPAQLAEAVQRLTGRDALRLGEAVDDSLPRQRSASERCRAHTPSELQRQQRQLIAHARFLPLAVLCIRGGDAAPAQSMQAGSGAAATMARQRQPAPLAAVQLVHMRQEDIDRLHDDDDDDGESAAAQQRSERGDRPLLRRDTPLPPAAAADGHILCLPACWACLLAQGV